MLKHFLKYLAGDVMVKLLGFLSLPLYTYFLTPEKYGTYALVISYVTLAVIVLPLNVHASISRFFYDDRLDIKTFMSTTLSLTLIILSISFIIIYSIDFSFISEVLGFDFKTFGTILLILAFLRIVFDIYKQTLIPQKKSKEYSLLMVIKSYTSFFLIIGSFILLEPSAINMMYAIVTAEILIFIYIINKMKEFFPLRLSFSSSMYIVNYSFFLMPYVLSSVLMSQIDTIMLAKFYSTKEVGVYNIAYVLSIVPLMLFTTFSNAWTPSYFKYMNDKDYEPLKRDVEKILIAVSIIVLFVSLYSSEIIWLLVDQDYQDSADILGTLTISVFFMVLWQMWCRGISYERKTIWTSVIAVVTAILNISLNYYLIPRYSMHGAVYATLISFIFMSFSGYYVSKHILKIYTVDIYTLRYIFAINIFTMSMTFVKSDFLLLIIKVVVLLMLCVGLFYFYNPIIKYLKLKYSKS